MLDYTQVTVRHAALQLRINAVVLATTHSVPQDGGDDVTLITFLYVNKFRDGGSQRLNLCSLFRTKETVSNWPEPPVNQQLSFEAVPYLSAVSIANW